MNFPFWGFLRLPGITDEPRAFALYCLLTQAIRSLMVCEKQMSAYAAACFSLHTLNHTINDQGNGNADNTCHSDLDGKSQSNDQYAKVND